MGRERSKWRKRLAFSFGLLFAAIGCLFIFRDAVVGGGARFYLTRSLSPYLSIQEGSLKKEDLTFSALHYQRGPCHVVIDRATLSAPYGKWLTHPKATLDLLRAKKEEDWSRCLIIAHSLGLSPKVPSGVMTLDGVRYFFNIQEGHGPTELGRIHISHDPGLMDHPHLTIVLSVKGEQLITQLTVDQMPSQQLLTLASHLLPESFGEFSGREGRIECLLSSIVDKQGKLIQLSMKLGLENVEVTCLKSGILARVDSLQGEFGYPEGIENANLPIWKRVRGYLAMESMDLNCGRLINLAGVSGTLSLDPRSNPTMTLTGELLGSGDPLALKLEGRGAFHDNLAYWLEFGLDLDDHKGTKCTSFLSLCRPENEALVLQVEADQLIPEQIAMLKGYFARYFPRFDKWAVRKGTLGGKLVALLEKNGLSSIELHKVHGSELALEWLASEELFSITSLEIDGRFTEFTSSPIGELQTRVEMPLCHLLHWPGKGFGDAYFTFRPDDPAFVSMQLKFQEDGVETLGSASFPQIDQAVQFGWTGPRAFPTALDEVTDGWLRSEQLSHLFYGPLVRLGSPDLEVYGDIDLVATYDGTALSFSLQVEEFLTKHPYFDLQVERIGEKEQTIGRAKLSYVPATETLEGVLPIQGGRAYDRTNGLLFEDLSGVASFSFGPDEWRVDGKATEGSILFDGTPLLTDVTLSLSADEKGIVFTESMGEIALQDSKPFHLMVPRFQFSREGAHVTAHLIDGKHELATLTLSKNKQWEGELLASTDTLKGKFACLLDWNRLEREVALVMDGTGLLWHGSEMDDLSLLLRHKGDITEVEQLTCGDVRASAKYENGNAQLSIRGTDFGLTSTGTISLEFPKEEKGLALLGDLSMTGELKQPVPIAFSIDEPFRFAFSPSFGWIASDVQVRAGESRGTISQIEKHFSNKRLAVRGATCSFSETLFSALLEEGAIPQIVGDFAFVHERKGEINLTKEGDRLSIAGILPNAANWTEGEDDLQFSLDVAGKECALLVSEKTSTEGLQIKGTLEEEGFAVASVAGELGSLKANLNALKGGDLEGSVDIDLSFLENLFHFPFNKFLTSWEVGAGYRLEGVFTPAATLADWQFLGKVYGESFTCKGIQIRSLETKVRMGNDQLIFEDLDLTDEAGKMWIGEGAVMLSAEDFIFHFPLVEIRGFQPSFLRKISGPEQQIDPLVIKRATIHNLTGSLSSLNRMTGKGSLRFVNRSPDGLEAKPKNLPIEAVQAVGLDGALFVPSTGEMDFVIADGRVYLSEMRDVYSEGRRSEFLLPKTRNLGYIDFEGNCFIDLQMRQSVAPHIRGPLSFSVRGKWSDPNLQIR